MDWWHPAEVGGSPRFKLLPQRMHVSAIHRDLECFWTFLLVGVSVRALMGVLRSHQHGRFLMKRAFIFKRPSADPYERNLDKEVLAVWRGAFS